MNKTELVSAVAEKTGLSKRECEKALNAVFDTITASLEAGEKVQIVGFGVFDVKKRSARLGRNPQTMEPIAIAPTRTAVFKPGKALREAVGAAEEKEEQE